MKLQLMVETQESVMEFRFRYLMDDAIVLTLSVLTALPVLYPTTHFSSEQSAAMPTVYTVAEGTRFFR